MTGKEDRLYDMSDQLCTGEEKLEDLKNTYLDVSQLRITNNVKQAVYAMAYGLDRLSRCDLPKRENADAKCSHMPDFEPRELPDSVCTKLCPPGTRKGIRQGQPICCFDCIPCADGYVSEKPGRGCHFLIDSNTTRITTCWEIGVCSAYLLLDPPRMYKNIEPQNVKIIFECNEGSIEFLCSIFGFDVLLALLCFLTTFVARQLPDNYYEGKCITFAMLVFFIVWISFVPAYLSTKGKFKVAVEIFAILASSYGLLGCIFLPKCFIILLRPKRNTEETVGGRVPTVDRSIQLTSASVSSELNNTTVSTVLDE
ncbi:Vomeronasal type-2 receptor 1 [Cricetulus griseus]|uniref:Vomeronasal type-2 receptor 1 n=1 Tax=Cricetulus griseus TaxID=10029 RepID=G3H227_CRIGR|nr:Vomeronasal type-2 receptor 1 [Cricetulus griseus]